MVVKDMGLFFTLPKPYFIFVILYKLRFIYGRFSSR